jgi:hypothetical protein
MNIDKNNQVSYDTLNEFSSESGPKIYAKYVSEEKFQKLKEAAIDGLEELERINQFLAINSDVIANLKNVLV